MSVSCPAPISTDAISFASHWCVPDDAEYGDWAGTLVLYALTHDDPTATLDELAAEIEVGLHPDNGDPSAEMPIPDDRASWHRNYTPLEPWMRAHVLRLARGWRSKRLATCFERHPEIARRMGFRGGDDGLGRFTATPPKQSRLWEMWHEEFTEAARIACKYIAEDLFQTARHHGIPAPDAVFEPDTQTGGSERSEQRLIAEKTQEVWQQAKPFVTDCFSLKRGQNWRIHENAFWEQHTYMGMREDMFANAGQYSFAIDSSRERTPSASNHRYQIQKLGVDEVRSMLRETTRMLIARARHNNELVGKLHAAIDITKGNPWTGQIERDAGNNNVEPWILGYKGGEYHYQWATIQIVGHDIPLVLDAIPVQRGFSRAHIVDELLKNGLDLLPDIELVMMDREFDAEEIKNVCERQGVYYLNPARKQASERATCTRLREAGKKVHVTEQTSLQGTTRKRMYLPARNYDLFATDETPDEDDGVTLRQELVDDFADIVEDTGESSPFDDLVNDIREAEDEEDLPGNDEDTMAYALFETNHPDLTVENAESGEELLRRVRSVVRKYRQRWGIENGYKKLKKFRVRTTSKNPQYRFFNFAFACVLYNVWRLVDLLVKLAIDADCGYAPRVDANQFLTVAKKFYGLDPPD